MFKSFGLLNADTSKQDHSHARSEAATVRKEAKRTTQTLSNAQRHIGALTIQQAKQLLQAQLTGYVRVASFAPEHQAFLRTCFVNETKTIAGATIDVRTKKIKYFLYYFIVFFFLNCVFIF
jgi:hypothetical protein